MKFYRLDEVPISRDDQVFKESLAYNAVWTVILLGGGIALAVFNSHWKAAQGMGHWIMYAIAAFIGLFGLIPLFNFRFSLKPSNWLLRCNLSGFFLKYRAYENWRLPADTLQVVGFDYGEIAWAKLVKERRTSPSMDAQHGNQTEWITYIDLGLAKPETTELEANLNAEQNLVPNGVVVTGDYPVRVLPGGIIEVRWTGGISPSARKALEVLSKRVKILDPEHRKTDLTHHYGVNPDDDKAKIVALINSGRRIEAVALTRRAYGCSLAQANDMVKNLSPRKDG